MPLDGVDAEKSAQKRHENVEDFVKGADRVTQPDSDKYYYRKNLNGDRH